jgi:4-hydroxybenzoate polyprenyltransferase
MAASGDPQFELALVPEPAAPPPPKAELEAAFTPAPAPTPTPAPALPEKPAAQAPAPPAVTKSVVVPSAAAPPPPKAVPESAVTPPAAAAVRSAMPRSGAAAPQTWAAAGAARAETAAQRVANAPMRTTTTPAPASEPTPQPAVEVLRAPPVFTPTIEPVRLTWRMRRLRDFAQLLRLDRPIGTWLLLWPMLWALWIAADGHPQRRLLAIFIAGAVLMRSAGCIINDLADRNIDPHVKRTRSRPLAARAISPPEALTVFGVLVAAALLLVLQLNTLTLWFALAGVALTVTYPLLKRFFPLPQLYLGLCFGWAVPMAFAATLGMVPRVGWLMLVAAILWAGVYDTMYAMVDRDDDRRIGVRSSAILFADLDRFMIAMMQLMMLFSLLLVGRTLKFGQGYQAGLIAGACCFLWQQWLIRNRDPQGCFQAFQNNNYFGFAVFAGVLLEYTSR